MAQNTGITYEIITKEIFQFLVSQNYARNIDIKHNISLQGKTTTHQIDVYWEFEFGGITYKTVVQAKDWAKAIDKGELLKFREVLSDLPGQPRGVMVTRSGYQSGAKEVARANGILLYELFEEPKLKIVVTVGSFSKWRVCKKTSTGLKDLRDPDVENEPRTLVMEIIVFDPVFSESEFKWDQVWLQKQKDLFGNHIISELALQKIKGVPHEIKFFDESGNIIGDAQEIFSSFVSQMREKEVLSERMSHEFQEPTFVKTSLRQMRYSKITTLSSSVRLNQRQPYIRPLRLDKMVNYILRNLDDGKEHVFGVKDNSGDIIDTAD